jgi:hypothetical protein
VFAQRPGQPARQAVDRRLGHRVTRVAAFLDLPADRAEVDDRTAAQPLHARHHGLDREQGRALVDGHLAVVVLRRYRFEAVAVVGGDVVHQDVKVAKRLRSVGDRGLQGRDVAHVAAPPPRAHQTGAGQAVGQRGAGLFGNVDKGDARTLPNEGLDDGLADARPSTGDEDAAPAEPCVTRRSSLIDTCFCIHIANFSIFLISVCRDKLAPAKRQPRE